MATYQKQKLDLIQKYLSFGSTGNAGVPGYSGKLGAPGEPGKPGNAGTSWHISQPYKSVTDNYPEHIKEFLERYHSTGFANKKVNPEPVIIKDHAITSFVRTVLVNPSEIILSTARKFAAYIGSLILTENKLVEANKNVAVVKSPELEVVGSALKSKKNEDDII